MSEYEMMKNMLTRVWGNEDGWNYDDNEHKIWIHCYDDWYTRIFTFNKNGELIKLE